LSIKHEITKRIPLISTVLQTGKDKVPIMLNGKTIVLGVTGSIAAYKIANLAHGIADDMLTTTALACSAPIVIAPAMNT